MAKTNGTLIRPAFLIGDASETEKNAPNLN
jgi:hypothetical protein